MTKHEGTKKREVEARLGNVEVGLGDVTSRLGNVEVGLGDVTSRLGNVEVGLVHLGTKVDGLTSEIHEFMGFVKDNVAMKADLENYATKDDLSRFATKDELSEVRHEVLNVSDQVTRLQITVEHELIAPTFRMDRMEGRLRVVETKLGLAA